MTDLSPTKPATKPWLTIIPDRSPREKMHATRGLAWQALAHDRSRYVGRWPQGAYEYPEGALYRWELGDWVLVWQGTLDPKTAPWKECT